MKFSLSAVVLAIAAGSIPFAQADRMTYYGLGSGGDSAPFVEQPGSCGSNYRQTPNDYFVAVNYNSYSSANCGRCAEIVYNGRCTVAPIVDKLPSRGSGLDLSFKVFSNLVGGADNARSLGIIDASWKVVDCPSYIGITAKKGTNNNVCSGYNFVTSGVNRGNQVAAEAVTTKRTTTSTKPAPRTTSNYTRRTTTSTKSTPKPTTTSTRSTTTSTKPSPRPTTTSTRRTVLATTTRSSSSSNSSSSTSSSSTSSTSSSLSRTSTSLRSSVTPSSTRARSTPSSLITSPPVVTVTVARSTVTVTYTPSVLLELLSSLSLTSFTSGALETGVLSNLE